MTTEQPGASPALSDQLGPGSEARNATVLGLNDVDKQKLEEARQLAMSMTSHPVAFGTIEHTEKAGELLAELAAATRWRSVEAEQPRNGQEVLATIYPYRNKINRQMIVHAVYVDAVWLDPADREPLHEPTHWMPAPALPDGA